MLNFDLYAIETMDDERQSSIKEFFTSFEEAKENRFKYAHWCYPKGYVAIAKYNANNSLLRSHTWYLNPEGNILEEYNF